MQHNARYKLTNWLCNYTALGMCSFFFSLNDVFTWLKKVQHLDNHQYSSLNIKETSKNFQTQFSASAFHCRPLSIVYLSICLLAIYLISFINLLFKYIYLWKLQKLLHACTSKKDDDVFLMGIFHNWLLPFMHCPFYSGSAILTVIFAKARSSTWGFIVANL